MSSPNATGWADRRALFHTGKEVHEPAPPRRPSIPKAASPPAPASPTAATGTSERRRSSASGAALFSNLHSQKRGSQDYGLRQQERSDMSNPKGVMGSFFDKVIKK